MRPAEDLIELLELLLVKARSGKVSALVGGYMEDNAFCSIKTAALSDMEAIGQLEVMKFSLLASMDGGEVDELNDWESRY